MRFAAAEDVRDSLRKIANAAAIAAHDAAFRNRISRPFHARSHKIDNSKDRADDTGPH